MDRRNMSTRITRATLDDVAKMISKKLEPCNKSVEISPSKHEVELIDENGHREYLFTGTPLDLFDKLHAMNKGIDIAKKCKKA